MFHRFILNGRALELDSAVVAVRMSGVVPEAVREHGVLVGGRLFPVKQAFEVATGLPRLDFTSDVARRHLGALGFDLVAATASAAAAPLRPAAPPAAATFEAGDWPWEGAVQSVFAAALCARGWRIDSTADTATKARGIDITASTASRRLGAEVKGWPSDVYADVRRAGEVKRTRPSTQARHWFSQALFAAMMLRDSHPDFESLVVLPDNERYRDLAGRTRTGRAAAGIHVVFVRPDGSVDASTWVL